MGAECSRPMRVSRQYGPAYYLLQYGGGNRCLCGLRDFHNTHYVYRDFDGIRRPFDPLGYIAAGGEFPQYWADPGRWTIRDYEVLSGMVRDVNDRVELNLARNRRDAMYPVGGRYGAGFEGGWNVGENVALLRRLEDLEQRLYIQGADARFRGDLQDYFGMNGGFGGHAAIALAQAGGPNHVGEYNNNFFGPLGLPHLQGERLRGDHDRRGQNNRRDQGFRDNGGGGSGSSSNNRRDNDHPFLMNMNNVRLGNLNDLERDLVYPMMEQDQHRHQDGRRVQRNYEDYDPYYKRVP